MTSNRHEDVELTTDAIDLDVPNERDTCFNNRFDCSYDKNHSPKSPVSPTCGESMILSDESKIGSAAQVVRSFVNTAMEFVGPGFVVAVGYMDPGNWATDLAGGSNFGYRLLFVVLLCGLLAIFLQILALRLGIASQIDLAQACRIYLPRPLVYICWFTAEAAIMATDIAEVLGSAVALQLLFNLPLVGGVIITAFDVLLLLVLSGHQPRKLEFIIASLILLILGSFTAELWMSGPKGSDVLEGFLPTSELMSNNDMLFVAIGILGATIMPHNLYLHSAFVQTRKVEDTVTAKTTAIRFLSVDTMLALLAATAVNAMILILAASALGKTKVSSLFGAYELLAPALGQKAGSIIFAVALLAAGQNSTLTGTMAGEVVMNGFLEMSIRPWVRRLVTRLLAICPAIVVVSLWGEMGADQLLIVSQVALSVQLPFAIIPLVYFTSKQQCMGDFASPWIVIFLGCIISAVIVAANVWLLATIGS